jgi:hypothetical protein
MSRGKAISAVTTSALETWASQKRQLYVTREQSIPSLLGKIKAQRYAAGEGDARLRQRWSELYVGDGATVEMISHTMRELPRLTLTYYYVLIWPWRVPVSAQAAELGVRLREYWTALYLAEAVIESGLALAVTFEQRRAVAERRATGVTGLAR